MKMFQPYSFKPSFSRLLQVWLALAVLLSACSAPAQVAPAVVAPLEELALAAPAQADLPTPTPQPERPRYQPGELVDYLAQTGDTLPALASRFNTSVQEILAANPFIPASATTMPPGMPMQIPIYYLPYWGSQYQILPDSLFVNGPAQVDFDIAAFVNGQPGWLNGYVEFASGANRSGAQIVQLVAQNYSVSPRLLLALLEYQSGALTQPASEAAQRYPMGRFDRTRLGLYRQAAWMADTLNAGYYGWRRGSLTLLEFSNSRLERPDPWQNAATVALQYVFSLIQTQAQFQVSISSEGVAATYRNLFGDPWANPQNHLEGSLQQPALLLPFERGKSWSYTGGPHTAWGSGEPWAAIDFAPPSVVGGCQPSDEWVTAVADGVVARLDTGVLELDLDGDGDPRTGWVLFYLHLATEGRAGLGQALAAGQPLGHPSCEGGTSTGTHIHIARKYNGEWIAADGVLAFNLEGYIAYNGAAPYQGTLRRFERVVEACTCSNAESQVRAGEE